MMTRRQVDVLRQQLADFGGNRRKGSPARGTYVRSGWRALDGLLPWGGFPRGALVEWLGPVGGGAGFLALLATRAAQKTAAPLVVVDPYRQFYPPAAAACGLAGDDLFLVRPTNPRDTLWALDQVLRCRGVSAVWGMVEELAPRSFRRLQLAAEEGGVCGHLVRPLRVRGQPSWAEIQLVVQPLRTRVSSLASSDPSNPSSPSEPLMGPESLMGRRWQIELTRYRGATRGEVCHGVTQLELNEQGQEIVRTTEEPPRHVSNSLPLVS